MKKICTVIFTVILVQLAVAQSITVDNFQHHKHYIWQINSGLPLDKKTAVVALKTEDKTFQFKTVKGELIDAEESDTGIILKVADKTKYIVINHPDFGELVWRVPTKYLKKHNYYTADLLSTDLTREFKNPNQWVVFKISPERAIVTMDSVMHRVANGTLSLYLPVGKHGFTIESPFYESMSDSIFLTDESKVEKDIFLEPLYSYLTVRTGDNNMDIFVDEELQGTGEVTVGRINEGPHRVSLLRNSQWVKDTIINIERAEKKTVTLDGYYKIGSTETISERFEKNPSPGVYREVITVKKEPAAALRELKNQAAADLQAPVRFLAGDSLIRIYIDREFAGLGEWSGTLPVGFHLVTTEKEGLESIAQYVEITDDSPREINLAVPQSRVAALNIHGNVPGITVVLNERVMGATPLVLKDVTADEQQTLYFSKEGYKDKQITVRPKGNDITEVYVELKKR